VKAALADQDFKAWRDTARALLVAGVAPQDANWGEAGDLFAGEPRGVGLSPIASPRVPRGFIDVARMALLHSDPARLALLYRVLWRLQRQPALLEDGAAPDVRRLHEFARAVHRDIHKMRAFVRFRRVMERGGGERFVAWFEPSHRVLRANAAFFLNRFASQRWSILTPQGSLHWDGKALAEGPTARRQEAPADNAAEDLWRTYYASIFNPARLKVGAMLKEMPRRYWANLPEAALIPGLIAGAQARESGMIERGAIEQGERPESLAGIAAALAVCRRCPIGCNGTRAVAGEGPGAAALMIVGEQPGDVEEESGRPFVGPAGRLLRGALDHAGLPPEQAYITNAVKHFKFAQQGKRRLHQSPTAGEIDTCRWWLEGERERVRPKLVLALGASAARGMLGRTVSVQRERGRGRTLPDGAELWITAHPSYLLRLHDEGRRVEEARFAQDLTAVARRLGELAGTT